MNAKLSVNGQKIVDYTAMNRRSGSIVLVWSVWFSALLGLFRAQYCNT